VSSLKPIHPYPYSTVLYQASSSEGITSQSPLPAQEKSVAHFSPFIISFWCVICCFCRECSGSSSKHSKTLVSKLDAPPSIQEFLGQDHFLALQLSAINSCIQALVLPLLSPTPFLLLLLLGPNPFPSFLLLTPASPFWSYFPSLLLVLPYLFTSASPRLQVRQSVC